MVACSWARPFHGSHQDNKLASVVSNK
jgi:hypothetical protein